jgi:hypothetical protein
MTYWFTQEVKKRMKGIFILFCRSKCEFWLKHVAFLRHAILKGGIFVDPSKVQDVLSWKKPTSVSDTRSFLRTTEDSLTGF